MLTSRLLPVIMIFISTNAFAAGDHDVPYRNLDSDICYDFRALAYHVEHDMWHSRIVYTPIQIVIDNDEDYQKLFDPKLRRMSCTDAEYAQAIDKVDFIQSTVLGFWAQGDCSATNFARKVNRDDEQKLITYSVKAINKPTSCMGPGLEGLNLIAIPKIPAGYRVVFSNEG